MKKSFLIFLIVTVMMFICGCDDDKPKDWDTSKCKWIERINGKVISKRYEGSNNVDYLIKFDGARWQIRCGNIANFKEIKIGTIGTLYKHCYGNADMWSWFKWVPDSETSDSVENTPSEQIPSEQIVSQQEIKKSSWIDVANKNPKRYTDVLIKFKNETISVGYINSINEWKLSINKLEKDGGKIIPKWEIISWKKVNTN